MDRRIDIIKQAFYLTKNNVEKQRETLDDLLSIIPPADRDSSMALLEASRDYEVEYSKMVLLDWVISVLEEKA